MLPIFIFGTIIFHIMTIFFLTIFHEEDTFEKDYISLRKQMIELEKIKENQQNLVVKEKELSPIMKRIKEISELSDISNVEEISEDKKKKNILNINDNKYSVELNKDEDDKFIKLCKKICDEKGHCNKDDFKKDFNKYLKCRDNIELCYKKCNTR